jgi:protein FAM50
VGSKKNPHVDTSFLPDRARDAAALARREALQREWVAQQEEAKKQVGGASVFV